VLPRRDSGGGVPDQQGRHERGVGERRDRTPVDRRPHRGDLFPEGQLQGRLSVTEVDEPDPEQPGEWGSRDELLHDLAAVDWAG
jgi:hypothetical protein